MKDDNHSMRVLAIIPGEEKGSSFIFAKRQVDSIKAKNIDIRTFYLSSRSNPLGVIKEIIRFKKNCNEFSPHVIHSHYGTVTSLIPAIFSSLPLVITIQGSDINYTPADGFFRDLFGRFFTQVSCLKAKKIVCVSRRLKERLWNNKKAITIANGINLDTFELIEKSVARNKLNWGLNDKVVLFNANNPVIKRLDVAEAAIEIVKNKIPEARLEILRGGIDPQKVPVYLNASDCLLICSDNEGSPLIVKESLACNLPICGTDVGDVKERIEESSPVAVVKQNAQAIAVGLIDLLKMETRSNGRQLLISQELDDKLVADKIIEIYKEACKWKD